MDPRARIGVVLRWRSCVAFHILEVQAMKTSRGLIWALDIWRCKVEQRTRVRTKDYEGIVNLGYWVDSD